MTAFDQIRGKPYLWPMVASATLLALIFLLSDEFKPAIITANLAAAAFLALVGMGQMFPIASGEGGIDLSIPFVMNFCAFLAVRLISDQSGSFLAAVALALLFGAIVGIINGSIVVRLQVPPIIGTLAVGFIILTFVQIIAANGATTIANRSITNIVRDSVFGVPVPFVVTILVGVLAHIVVTRTAFGRALLAIGQSRRAAYLAGLNVERTIMLAYMVSGSMAGLTGVLLACSVGSADLELGNPFLLTSVGAVVLGGNRIAGGTASILGTIFGAILLTLLIAMVTVAGLPIEMKNIASGLVITLVLVAANQPLVFRRIRRSG